jgi:golgi SNAP receptor complex member 1
LRQEARRLENEVDLKLVGFSKLGTGISSNFKAETYKKAQIKTRFLRNSNLFFSSSDSAPLLGPDHVFETMALEIEALLEKVPNQPAEELKNAKIYCIKFNF